MKRRQYLVCVLLLATGCWRVTFVSTDSAFQRAPGAEPDVYLDRLPDRPYQSVGILEVTGPAIEFDLDAVIRRAKKKGRELGCDLIVDRSIHRVSMATRQPILLAQLGHTSVGQYTTTQPQPFNVYNAPPPGRREFVCGIWASE
jgi:hypothetical protein